MLFELCVCIDGESNLPVDTIKKNILLNNYATR